MAKTRIVKKGSVPKGSLGTREREGFIPERWQTPVYLAIVLILILIFFRAGIFGDKVFSSADNIASGSFNTFLQDADKEGMFALWVPYIFLGMPSFAALIPFQERMYDWSYAAYAAVRNVIYSPVSNSPVWHVVVLYIVFAFGFYFLAEYLFGKTRALEHETLGSAQGDNSSRLIGLYCAIAAVFVTPIIQFIIVGHNSKMIAIMMFPWVMLMVVKIENYFNPPRPVGTPAKEGIFRLFLYFGILAFCLHVQMSSNHPQMLFYLYFGIGVYLLYRLIHSGIKVVKKDKGASSLAPGGTEKDKGASSLAPEGTEKDKGASSLALQEARIVGVFVLAMLLSAAMYADSYLSIKEYNKYSIRGQAAITREAETGDKQPLDYEYATNWSFSPGEVMTFFIPYWQGFGDVEYQGQRLNTYWGQMPFTTSPVYFGVLTLLLAIIGTYYNFRKNALIQAMVLISVLGLFMSFGRTFPVLFNLLYYHFPFFSSFRAPVMALILVDIPVVILAGYGLKTIIDLPQGLKDSKQKFLNGAKYVFPILALPIIFSIIGFKGYYGDMVSSSPLVEKLKMQAASQQQISQYISQITQIAYDNVKSEMLLIGILLLACYGMCYLLVKGKVKVQLFFAAIILLTLFDLWHIDFKTLHWDNKTEMESAYRMPDYVDWILKNEKDKNYEYRVVDLDNMTTNVYATWRMQSVNGYQGAKIRNYQDMVDVAGLASPMVWKLTNTKYVISNKPVSDTSVVQVFKGSRYVFMNKDFMPRAFFVSSYQIADGLQILKNIADDNFDARKVVFFEKDPGVKIDTPDSTANVKVTDYGIHSITLEAEASGNNLLFLSEVYYPAGWKAFIDGQETEIYKTDYLFRSIVVPKGKHKLEFKFEPEAYYTGRKIVTAGNILLIIVLVVGAGGVTYQRLKIKKKLVNS